MVRRRADWCCGRDDLPWMSRSAPTGAHTTTMTLIVDGRSKLDGADGFCGPDGSMAARMPAMPLAWPLVR